MLLVPLNSEHFAARTVLPEVRVRPVPDMASAVAGMHWHLNAIIFCNARRSAERVQGGGPGPLDRLVGGAAIPKIGKGSATCMGANRRSESNDSVTSLN